jgi:hypothetical protein
LPLASEKMTTLNEALRLAWAGIRRRNPGVPRAIVVTDTREQACGAVKWDRDPVVTVGLPVLAAGAEEILHDLLHQAAHGIGGTSEASGGRWHDRAYQVAAESLGLKAATGRAREGWHDSTTLPDATRDRYRKTLDSLNAALEADRPVLASAFERNGVVAVCACHPARKIRIRGRNARQELAAHPIRCEACDAHFTPELA